MGLSAISATDNIQDDTVTADSQSTTQTTISSDNSQASSSQDTSQTTNDQSSTHQSSTTQTTSTNQQSTQTQTTAKESTTQSEAADSSNQATSSNQSSSTQQSSTDNKNTVSQSVDNTKNVKTATESTQADTNNSLKTATDTITITPDNYNTYFDRGGNINVTALSGATDIVLSGTFEDTYFTIRDTSVTITGENALLEGTIIDLVSDNNVVRNITINNSNKDYGVGIEIEGNNNVVEYCNITDYSTEPVNEVFITGSNNTVRYNIINVGGPSSELDWDDPLDLVNTLSVTIMGSGNTVQYNNITTYSTISTWEKGQVESITIQGTYDGAISQNNTVEYNNIYTDVENNAYGVNLGINVDNNTVRYNNITSIGAGYVVGVNLFSTGSNLTLVGNNIKINSTGEGCAISIAKDNMAGITENNTIKDNTATIDAASGVFIDTNKMNTSVVSNNTGVITGNSAEGIYINGEHNNVTDNTVTLNSLNETTAGIMLVGANYTSVTGNTIKTNTTYTVGLTNSNYNNITDNYLESDKLKGDDSVSVSGTGNTVKNNSYINPLKTTITVADTTAVYNSTITLTATVVDEDNNMVTSGTVGFKLNGNTIKDSNGNTVLVNVTNGVATLVYNTTHTPKEYTITGLYYGDDAYKDSKSTTDGILKITNKNADLQITTRTDNLKSGDTLHITTIITSDGRLVDGGIVIFKLNGVTLRDADGTQLNASVVNGTATFDYVIPVGYSAKDYLLTAVYSNKYYDRAEVNTTITLVKSDISTDLSPVTINKGENATIIATLYDEHGNQLERDTKVAIKANGKTLLNVNTTKGVLNATIPTSTFSNQYYNLTIIFGENSAYNQLVVNTTLLVDTSQTTSTYQLVLYDVLEVNQSDNSTNVKIE